MISIGIFGECMLENSINAQGFGGDTYNTAIYLARLAAGKAIKVSYITAVGKDSKSQQLLDLSISEGLDITYILEFDDRFLGKYSISVDNDGERAFSYDRDESAVKHYFRDLVTPFERALANKSFDYVYLSGVSLAILSPKYRERLLNALKAYREIGGKVIFDNNYREVLWNGEDPVPYYQKIMEISNIALLTDDDEYAVYGENSPDQILNRCRKLNIEEVVIKRGALPCVAVERESVVEVAANYVESVVDTTAAGDSFGAGYLYSRLLGCNTQQSAKNGHWLAGVVISHEGAIIAKKYLTEMPI